MRGWVVGSSQLVWWDPCSLCCCALLLSVSAHLTSRTPHAHTPCPQQAHKKAIRRATVNTFGYIAKAIGPQDVLVTLLNNLKVRRGGLVGEMGRRGWYGHAGIWTSSRKVPTALLWGGPGRDGRPQPLLQAWQPDPPPPLSTLPRPRQRVQVQERQNRVCTTVAIAIVAETCAPFTVLPALMNEYKVGGDGGW